MLEEDEVLELGDDILPDEMDINFTVSSGGGYRLNCTVPAGLCPAKGKAGLLKIGDSFTAHCVFPWRKIAKIQARMCASRESMEEKKNKAYKTKDAKRGEHG